jgi:small GTP-binding protein
MGEIKVVVFGLCPGISELIAQFSQGNSTPQYDQTTDSFHLNFLVDEKNYQLDILLTAGGDDFSPMRVAYMRQGRGFLLVYAIDNRKSFEEIETYHRDILNTKGKRKVPVVICGNNCDLEDQRQVSKEEGEELAKKLNSRFFEISAKTNTNIENAFSAVVKEVEKEDEKEDSEASSQVKSKTEKSKKSSCNVY